MPSSQEGFVKSPPHGHCELSPRPRHKEDIQAAGLSFNQPFNIPCTNKEWNERMCGLERVEWKPGPGSWVCIPCFMGWAFGLMFCHLPKILKHFIFEFFSMWSPVGQLGIWVSRRDPHTLPIHVRCHPLHSQCPMSSEFLWIYNVWEFGKAESEYKVSVLHGRLHQWGCWCHFPESANHLPWKWWQTQKGKIGQTNSFFSLQSLLTFQ